MANTSLLDSIVTQKLDEIKQGNPGFDEKPNFISFYNTLKTFDGITTVTSTPEQINTFIGYFPIRLSNINGSKPITYLIIPNTVFPTIQDKKNVYLWFKWLDQYSSLPQTKMINSKWNVTSPFGKPKQLFIKPIESKKTFNFSPPTTSPKSYSRPNNLSLSDRKDPRKGIRVTNNKIVAKWTPGRGGRRRTNRRSTKRRTNKRRKTNKRRR